MSNQILDSIRDSADGGLPRNLIGALAPPDSQIESFHAGYTSLLSLHPGVRRGRTAKGKRISAARLPVLEQGAQQLVTEYLRTRTGAKVEFLKHLQLVDGRPVRVTDDGRELPDPEQLVLVTRTLSFAAGDEERVITDLFVGRRTSGARSKKKTTAKKRARRPGRRRG